LIILVKLILAYLIGDFLLQPSAWVKNKERNKAKSIYLYAHIFVHGILILLIFWTVAYWHIALTIMILHGTIDTIKLYAQKESNKSKWFITNQVLQILSILVLWACFFKPEIHLNSLITTPKIWVYSTAFLVITAVSGIVIRELMFSWSKSLDDHNEESLSQAGKYIGILERLFVFIFVITNNWEGIGFLLAAKSVFRFGDLKESKDRKLTEYILIGTLLSFGIAMAMGMLVLEFDNYV
jgi:protein-S-isoprenylcysteine O-methyltransferase Ste14